MSDHDFLVQQKLKLQTICQRTMAVGIGRGMFTLSTMHPIITQKVPVPPLDVSGRAVGSGASIVMDTSLPSDYLTWPQFSNGVAAALRIGPAGTTKLSTTWIAYHKCGLRPVPRCLPPACPLHAPCLLRSTLGFAAAAVDVHSVVILLVPRRRGSLPLAVVSLAVPLPRRACAVGTPGRRTTNRRTSTPAS